MERGYKVRALVRPTSRLRELDLETALGDLRDKDSLARAARGCSLVFHVAADYRLWARNPSELYQSNVEGTRNLLEAARQAGVERVIYTSTVGCIGVPKGGVGDETNLASLSEMVGAYKRSKFLAEQVAMEWAGSGLPVVVVNPTAPVGDHDFKPTPTGRIILDYLRGNMPAFVDTGLNLVDVWDTAEGHLQAAEHGRPGERYILGCQNLTLQQILERLAQVAGGTAPTLKIPLAVAYTAGLASCAWARLTRTEPAIPWDGVRMASKKMFVTHSKAERELGYHPGPVEVALARAVAWFRANGYC